jgi:hypothetical protein
MTLITVLLLLDFSLRFPGMCISCHRDSLSHNLPAKLLSLILTTNLHSRKKDFWQDVGKMQTWQLSNIRLNERQEGQFTTTKANI